MCTITTQNGQTIEVNIKKVHTLVLGSGAAGLCAAVRLHAEGIRDLCIVTEGLDAGTSINTGSDKQTYYKLSLCGDEPDSPVEMAKTYMQAGGMHGDLALVEAAMSARAFLHLVNLGVPFPTDAYGQFVGYKTDHDPRRRATSIGPYTSREMCRALIRRVRELVIPIDEGEHAVELVVLPEQTANTESQKTTDINPANHHRVGGVITVNESGRWSLYCTENVIFAVGGPGGLYQTSVYPTIHTGAIGLALQVGALAVNLPESQFGLASIKHRWNVSGTYMQVIPRVLSTDIDGISHPREFLNDYFGSVGETCSQLFLKGYQWPFDSRKVKDGSSLIDLLVYQETMLKGRRVFLDYRQNPAGLDFATLSNEAKTYLDKSNVLPKTGRDTLPNISTPIDRLAVMNPDAIQLYLDHGIDIRNEMLEISLCAQHNNGGLAASHWWESLNIKHLFPVGEVNGSHGVARPGGSALNAGQVGAFRAAEYIARCYQGTTCDPQMVIDVAMQQIRCLLEWCERSKHCTVSWKDDRAALQQRMSQFGAAIRSQEGANHACEESIRQYGELLHRGCHFDTNDAHATHHGDTAHGRGMIEALRNRQLVFAAIVYLSAIEYSIQCRIGSRGSAIVLDAKNGKHIHEQLDDIWRMAPENMAYRDAVQLSQYQFPNLSVLKSLQADSISHHWEPCRHLPSSDLWFENAWAAYRDGKIYHTQ